MLKKIRITLATLVFIGITALFLDFTGTLHHWLGWLAKIQFMPALLATNIVIGSILLFATILFGRVYCSVICPLGIMQDIISWFASKRKGGKFRFSYSPEKKWIRYGVLALFFVAFVFGASAVVSILEPYSSFGRIAQNFLSPIYIGINNILAYIAERAGSYAFYEKEIWIKSGITLGITIATFAVIAYLAWKNGRTYCNTICPVGTFLGLVSKNAIFKISINEEKCNGCGLCGKSCKAACIDTQNHSIDYSRCVVCGDCLDNCKKEAISYKFNPKGIAQRNSQKNCETNHTESTPDTSRRSFLTGVALATGSVAFAQEKKKVDGGLAAIEEKKVPERETPITPPGSQSAWRMAHSCTACQLCVSACPNDVLRPSTDLSTLMQPTLSFERGYCRPECTRCGEVCPTGAIKPIDRAEKSSTQIGHAVWIKKNCIPISKGDSCDNCARHCPTGAIQMINSVKGDDSSKKIPAINVEKCIGCGACEHLCPARPFSAIYVEGHESHRII